VAKKATKRADEQLLHALACGATVEAAARQAGVSPATVYRRLQDAAFTRRLQRLRGDMVQRTAGALTAAATEAVRTLLELMKPASPHASRLGAAKAVLEIGMKVREMAELEERMTTLEEQLAAGAAAGG
jgi:AcrR family transcriptional regulator